MKRFKNMTWSPEEYDETAVIAREAAKEIEGRLNVMMHEPHIILDVGCGTSESSLSLRKRYPNAQVFSCDLNLPLLEFGKKRETTHQFFCADSENLPLKSQSVDLVFANMVLPWHNELTPLLAEFHRVLKKDGVFIFSALGLDTLQEWRSVLSSVHIPQFIDMHDLGDLLLQTGFLDPVVDVDYITLIYRNLQKCLYELRTSGMWFPENDDNTLKAAPAQQENAWHVTYEIIYGHAFASAMSAEDNNPYETKVSLAQMRSLLRGK